MSELEPTQFIERPVPLDVRNLGVARAWKPADGRDFRLVLEADGTLATFPRTPLTDADKAGIVLLMAEEGIEVAPPKPTLAERIAARIKAVLP